MDKRDYYEAVLELMTEGCVITDREGKHVFFNTAYTQMSGISAGTMNTNDVHQLLKKKIVTKTMNPLVVRTGQPQKGICVSKQGSTYTLSSFPLFNDAGKVEYVATLSRDISELERLRSEVEEQKRLIFATGVGSIPHAAFSVIESRHFIELIQKIMHVADTPATILLLGESGVGKSMYARKIHEFSSRSTRKFITVDCSCLPENLIEVELFGYAPGTFTGGSVKGKVGLIEAANSGTLFLDEIGELPLHLQSRLLRVLQEREVLRMGATTPVKIDARFIVATNKDLQTEVDEGRFRKDLYYRLKLLPFTIPPLREHREDIIPLATCFVLKYSMAYSRSIELSEEAAEILATYDWPGNIRELDQYIHGLVLTLGKKRIEKSDLYSLTEKSEQKGGKNRQGMGELISDERLLGASFKELKKEFEKELLIKAVKLYKTRISLSEHLKIDRVTLFRKLKEYEIDFED